MKVLRDRKGRLIVLFGVVIVIAMLKPLWDPRYDLFFNERFNSQWKHLEQVHDHIEAIGPQWNAFTNRNPEFRGLQLFPYTGGDGMLGAVGVVPSEQDLQRLREFLIQTRPPRPIYLNLVTVTDSLSEVKSDTPKDQKQSVHQLEGSDVAVSNLNQQIEKFNTERPGEMGITPITQRVSRIDYASDGTMVRCFDLEGALFLVLTREPNGSFRGSMRTKYHELPKPEGHSWGEVIAEFTLPSEVKASAPK